MQEVSLYVVATPIGNMSDMPQRGVQVLSEVDFVCAEDTRKSGLLLKRLGIKKPMLSYHEHNAAARGPQIVEKLMNGQRCALVSDAGMPAISDPGQMLVRQCLDAGLRVSAIPGPCAAVTALAMSGISSLRFCFEGFLGSVPSDRRARLSRLSGEERTLIIYEAPHRLRACLEDMLQILGNRQISVVREISKIYEQVIPCTLAEAVDFYKENEPRGEYVLIVTGCEPQTPHADAELLREEYRRCLESGMTRSESARGLASKYGLNRRDVYEMFKDETF